MEKEQQNNQNTVNKKKEKFSKLSSALKENLLRRKSLKKQSIKNSPKDDE